MTRTPGPRPWTTIARERIQQCRVFDVERIRARCPRTGEDHDFFGIDAVDWVNIIPITPEGQVVMVRQFRHGAQRLTLEVPGGMVDPGESAAEAAARELLEETGYRVAEVLPLGGVNPNPALFGNRLHAFLGRDARRVAEVRPEGTEETAVELVDAGEVRKLVLDGVVDHALVVAAFSLFDLHQALGREPGSTR
jgi:8-oxo-dGTP pyrophosphatase MutT (NUDIX family)